MRPKELGERRQNDLFRARLRAATGAIRRELRRRSAVEPVIGHAKVEHRMGRNFLETRRSFRVWSSSTGPGPKTNWTKTKHDPLLRLGSART